MKNSIRIVFLSSIFMMQVIAGCKKDDSDNHTGVPVITSMHPTSGSKGTIVTLEGKGFTYDISNIAVYLNGKRAGVLSASPESILFEVPAGAGDGTVVVTVNGVAGTGVEFDFIFTVAVTTFSGTSLQPGYVDGAASVARFNKPAGMAVDSNNNIYIADELNHVIRRIDANGYVSTFCGSGVPGHQDGGPLTTQFQNPVDITYDAANNFFYVADKGNHCIRKISFSGNSYTVAGIPATPGYVDAPGNSARFVFPSGVAVPDESGKVYITDAGNHCIRMINEAGVVSTLAGSLVPGSQNGTGPGAGFASPLEIAPDWVPGYLIVTDNGNHNVRRISVNGDVTTLAGTTFPGFADGPGSSALFNAPRGVSTFGKDKLVCDANNHRIRLVDKNNVVYTLAGNGTGGHADGDGMQAVFNQPSGIIRDTFGSYFITDSGNNTIRKIVMD